MAATRHVQHVRTSQMGKQPSASDIYVGELAINLKDKRLFTKTGAGTIIGLYGNVNVSGGTGISVATSTTHNDTVQCYTISVDGAVGGSSTDAERHVGNTNTSDKIYLIGTKVESSTTSEESFKNEQVYSVGGSVHANSFFADSDARLKENIQDIAQEDIDRIKDIDLKQYNFINDEKKVKKYGMMAQDLQEVGLDNLVSGSQEETYSVDYISFLILKVAQLEQEIKKLKEGK